ncbi:MAG: hypothetical protein LBC59_06540 [Chitinispirillales bacterium]|nr:hypothetical protein [Chitinispirillales bacterium]
MLRKRVFPVAVAVAAALALGGCSRVVKEASFRSIELTPVSQADVETVAELQVVSAKKVIGVAKGVVTSPEQRQNLYVEALELAIASDPSGADVLVAPSYFELTEDMNVTVTVVGYPARYKNFRRGERAPFSVRQLPGGVTVISYDKNAFKAQLASDNVIALQARGSGKSNAAPPVALPSVTPPPVAPPPPIAPPPAAPPPAAPPPAAPPLAAPTPAVTPPTAPPPAAPSSAVTPPAAPPLAAPSPAVTPSAAPPAVGEAGNTNASTTTVTPQQTGE